MKIITVGYIFIYSLYLYNSNTYFGRGIFLLLLLLKDVCNSWNDDTFTP
jgi:hypothetical protein